MQIKQSLHLNTKWAVG